MPERPTAAGALIAGLRKTARRDRERTALALAALQLERTAEALTLLGDADAAIEARQAAVASWSTLRESAA